MKRTINEIYDLIKQKIENAERDRDRTIIKMQSSKKEYKENANKYSELIGEIQAYTDIKILIATSEVLEE